MLPERSDRRDAARVFAAYLLAPAAAFTLWSNFVIGSAPLLRWLDRYRPPPTRAQIRIDHEAQVLHLEARRRAPVAPPVVAIAGSSAVLGGVDTVLLGDTWARHGSAIAAANYGLTAFSAHDLPLIKRDLLAPGVRMVVYLYNTFAFSNRYHTDAIGVRFDAVEFVRLFGWRAAFTDDFARGTFAQTLFVVRYRNLLRDVARRGVARDLEPDVETPRYAVLPPVAAPWRRNCGSPAQDPDTAFARARYVQSDTDSSTAGYRGLERFLALARARGIPVVIAPMPEPDFAFCLAFKRGTDERRVDAHVERIAAAAGVPFLPRGMIADLEHNDPVFSDYIHLDADGRERYSRFLATALLPTLPH